MNTPWITIFLLVLSPLTAIADNCTCKSLSEPPRTFRVSNKDHCAPKARGEFCKYKREFETQGYFTPDYENGRAYRMAEKRCQDDCYAFEGFKPWKIPKCMAVCRAETTNLARVVIPKTALK